MVERAIEEGFVDCPKFGIIDEIRCLPSCQFHDTKHEQRVVCRFGEPPPANAEQAEARASTKATSA